MAGRPDCGFPLPSRSGFTVRCEADATVRFRIKEDSWPLQYSCAQHRDAKRQSMQHNHPGQTVIEEDM